MGRVWEMVKGSVLVNGVVFVISAVLLNGAVLVNANAVFLISGAVF